MTEKITCKFILDEMQERVENKIPVDPSWWIDASSKLMVLIGDEHDKYYELEEFINKKKAEYLRDGESAPRATILVEALPEHRLMRRQKAYIEQIVEFVRLAKKRSSLGNEEYRLQPKS